MASAKFSLDDISGEITATNRGDRVVIVISFLFLTKEEDYSLPTNEIFKRVPSLKHGDVTLIVVDDNGKEWACAPLEAEADPFFYVGNFSGYQASGLFAPSRAIIRKSGFNIVKARLKWRGKTCNVALRH